MITDQKAMGLNALESASISRRRNPGNLTTFIFPGIHLRVDLRFSARVFANRPNYSDHRNP
jgi:hypothetical protein